MTEPESYSVDAICDWLVARIATELKIAPEAVPLDEAFFNIGLNSLNTLIISTELSEFLNVDELNPTLFWDYPSIQKLSEHLAESLAGAAQRATHSGDG